jgi:hypothetical protein
MMLCFGAQEALTPKPNRKLEKWNPQNSLDAFFAGDDARAIYFGFPDVSF